MSAKSTRDLNGYRLVYDPKHRKAMRNRCWRGYVYEHIKIAEKFLGRPLNNNEVVHHLDQDRSNNRKANLIVLLRSQHIKLHAWLDLDKSAVKDARSHRSASCCSVCGQTLQGKQRRCCSTKCLAKHKESTSKRPSKRQLKSDLNSGASYLALGRKYGVSDNAVRKWARLYALLT